ncbi:anaerobic glycerol-3-phosphate dehydrogenase subunit C [Schaalia vaccimaxillae]|uniref:anaerobic glycerol-3-phosphate dehydrogenase subunit C n=1 Tax=Schaalia vaccimaxillae TaxID=183916 RepID=UPI0003B552D4|nr:anaerobic glycerol-3-phosphate dehydrogenase subunit C [Schaalia vaccimaxillae]
MTIEEMSVLDLHDEDFGLRNTLDACVKCTICETQCPVMRVTDLFPGPKYSGPQAERYRKPGQIVDSSIDYCSSCGTCSTVCPQGVKVTEMIHHARTDMKKQKGIPFRDQIIGRTGFIGTAMTPVAPIANWALDVKPIRFAMEKVIGVHRAAPMPKAAGRTFEGWFKKHTPLPQSGTKGQVIFFHGCAGQYFEVETSIHSVQVLEYLGYEVLVPKHGCCGLALQSNGLYDEARKYVTKLSNDLRSANRNAPIISASGSCGGMLRHEAREILGVESPELEDVGARTWDICEFLMHLHDKGELDLNFQPMDVTIPYHAPCQLKSQGFGLPAVELMQLIPGVTVKESNQPCCGIAGTYGMKKEKYDIAQAVGQPVFDFIKQVNVELAACDTETCRWQLRTATGANVVHPIWLIHKAYGLR